MTDILGRLGNLGEMGTDALLTLLSSIIDAIGQGTEFTGEQIDRLGDAEQRLADLLRRVRDTEVT